MYEYRCPVCGVRDENYYLICHRPDCTDGRDQRPQIRLSDGTDISRMTVDEITARQRRLSPKFPTIAEADARRRMWRCVLLVNFVSAVLAAGALVAGLMWLKVLP
jgi:hypothetical protein